MTKTRITVKTSIEFRDAVMRLAKTGGKVYARPIDAKGRKFHIIAGLADWITWANIIDDDAPPIRMEDFAGALWRSGAQNEETGSVEVFTVEGA